MISLEKVSPFILRIGLGFLFLYYGSSKFFFEQKPAVPSKLLFYLPLSETALLYVGAIIQIVLGLFILIGLFTRTFSVISAVFILGGMILAGFSLESLSSFIVVCVSISLAMSGSGSFAIDNLIHGGKTKGGKKQDYLNYDL